MLKTFQTAQQLPSLLHSRKIRATEQLLADPQPLLHVQNDTMVLSCKFFSAFSSNELYYLDLSDATDSSLLQHCYKDSWFSIDLYSASCSPLVLAMLVLPFDCCFEVCCCGICEELWSEKMESFDLTHSLIDIGSSSDL